MMHHTRRNLIKIKRHGDRVDTWGAYHLHGMPGNSGWKTKMVHTIPFETFQKLWATGLISAFFLFFVF